MKENLNIIKWIAYLVIYKLLKLGQGFYTWLFYIWIYNWHFEIIMTNSEKSTSHKYTVQDGRTVPSTSPNLFKLFCNETQISTSNNNF